MEAPDATEVAKQEQQDEANKAADQNGHPHLGDPPPAPAEAQAAEKSTYQLVYTKYDDGDAMHRAGVPSKDPTKLTEEAIELLRRFDVHEVFLCTVHASFGKEILIKRII